MLCYYLYTGPGNYPVSLCLTPGTTMDEDNSLVGANAIFLLCMTQIWAISALVKESS